VVPVVILAEAAAVPVVILAEAEAPVVILVEAAAAAPVVILVEAAAAPVVILVEAAAAPVVILAEAAVVPDVNQVVYLEVCILIPPFPQDDKNKLFSIKWKERKLYSIPTYYFRLIAKLT
jgi:hypothetical protein